MEKQNRKIRRRKNKAKKNKAEEEKLAKTLECGLISLFHYNAGFGHGRNGNLVMIVHLPGPLGYLQLSPASPASVIKPTLEKLSLRIKP